MHVQWSDLDDLDEVGADRLALYLDPRTGRISDQRGDDDCAILRGVRPRSDEQGEWGASTDDEPEPETLLRARTHILELRARAAFRMDRGSRVVERTLDARLERSVRQLLHL